VRERPEPNPELGPLVVQLTVPDSAAAVAFYVRAFGASELYRNTEAAGGRRVVHCELLVAGARLQLNDEFPEHGLLAPASLGGTSATFNLWVPDVDATYAQAIAAGGRMLSPPADRFWGARCGALVDPFGHRWNVSTQIEDLAPDEIIRRSNAAPTDVRLGVVARSPAPR
jgi:PhnB protein